jgi:hypothetical protein
MGQKRNIEVDLASSSNPAKLVTRGGHLDGLLLSIDLMSAGSLNGVKLQ